MSDMPTSGEGGSTVLSWDGALTRETAQHLVTDIENDERPVVVDLSNIPAFDTDGAALLLDLQDRLGADRVRIEGLGEAAARLLGLASAAAAGETPAPQRPDAALPVTTSHNISVIRAEFGTTVTGALLDQALASAVADDAAIVVVDLKGVVGLAPDAVESLAFASSEAAVRSRELLVVNASAVDAAVLQRSALSATTYVAPEALP